MRCVLGIDVGGTKTAGGIVILPEGRVLARRVQPTLPERGGEAVLQDVIDLARSLQEEAAQSGISPDAMGVGVAEMVDPAGRVVSAATIGWKDVAVAARVQSATSLPTRVDADVRAAARAEAVLGAGRGFGSFLYVTVGTGISSALVLGGEPYVGARGLTGTFASSRQMVPEHGGGLAWGPPLEEYASGPAIARRLAQWKRGFSGTAVDALALAEAGDDVADFVVETSGRALGAAIAQLVNVLDPAAVVIGGGLGLAGGIHRKWVEDGLRSYVWSDLHQKLPLVPAALGNDAGWIGAALAAARA